jgi:hypothetical protein
VSPDGQSFWAWCQTDTNVIFGIGRKQGDIFNWYYADVGEPGPLGEDPRWISELDEHPDWHS